MVACEIVDYGSDDGEYDDFGDCDGPQRFWKIGGISHLSDERWECDLADECVADVEESRHALDEGCSLHRKSRDDWVAQELRIALWVLLDAGEDGGEDYGDECEDCGSEGELGEAVECTGEGTDKANDC